MDITELKFRLAKLVDDFKKKVKSNTVCSECGFETKIIGAVICEKCGNPLSKIPENLFTDYLEEYGKLVDLTPLDPNKKKSMKIWMAQQIRKSLE